jgi:hypothetical protein
MDYTIIAPIIQDTIKDVLSQRVYPFGFANVRGLSDKVASGRLRNSVQVNIVPSQDRPIIQILLDNYWQWVQSGRLPGKKGVPLDAIEQWIRSRGLTGRDKKGRFIKRRSFAFAIQTNIKKFGIRPANFLDVAFNLLLTDQRIIDALEGEAFEELVDRLEIISK